MWCLRLLAVLQFGISVKGPVGVSLMNIAGFGNLVACYCAFDYRWRPVARDKGDPPFSWSLSLCWGSAVRKRSFVTGPINKFVFALGSTRFAR
eukprot:scaffold34695_cov70-Phaeocystis_antarctica.AAC.1